MRLLYIWINETENTFLKNKEFNFTLEYKFHYDTAKKILDYNEIERKKVDNKFFSLSETSNIDMVNAIVGNNGSGKTTLLKHIFDIAPTRNQNNNYKYWQAIQIYEVNETIKIYHNVDISNYEELKKKNSLFKFQEISDETIKRGLVAEEMETGFESTLSKIFLSNSEFDYTNQHFTNKIIQKIAFTGYDLNINASIFFDNCKLNQNGIYYFDDNFYKFNKMLHTDASLSHYIEGFLFFNLYANEIKKRRSIKDKTTTHPFYNHLNLTSIHTIKELIAKETNLPSINKLLEFIKNIKEENKHSIGDKYYSEFYQNYKNENFTNDECIVLNRIFSKLIEEKFNVDSFGIIGNLYQSLLLESIITFYKFIEINYIISIFDSKEKDDIHIIDRLQNNIKNLIKNAKILDKKIEELDKKRIEKRLKLYKKYYTEALRKLKKMYEYNNFNKKRIEIKELSKLSINFLQKEIQNNTIEKSPSFILKYLFVSSQLSSGERALYRLMSWLYSCVSADIFVNLNKEKNNPLGDNLLILIDELDLYCHPQWQREILYDLICNLNKFFPKNHIHLIYSTHSPLTLSDLPSQYILKLKDGKIEPNTKQTFGANIYDLLDDEFFLKDGFTGKFATKKIEQIIDEVNKSKEKKLSKDKFNDLRNEINIIGDPLIRNKLLSLLDMYNLDKKELIKNKIKELQDKLGEIDDTN